MILSLNQNMNLVPISPNNHSSFYEIIIKKMNIILSSKSKEIRDKKKENDCSYTWLLCDIEWDPRLIKIDFLVFFTKQTLMCVTSKQIYNCIQSEMKGLHIKYFFNQNQLMVSRSSRLCVYGRREREQTSYWGNESWGFFICYQINVCIIVVFFTARCVLPLYHVFLFISQNNLLSNLIFSRLMLENNQLKKECVNDSFFFFLCV